MTTQATERINITRTSVLRTVPTRWGRPATVYEVEATREDGSPFDRPLRTFHNLPLGAAEVVLDPYTERDGTPTLTVKLPSAKGSRPAPPANVPTDIVKTIEDMQRRIGALERAMLEPAKVSA